MKKILLILFTIAYPIILNATDIVEINGIFYELKPVKVGTAAVNYDPANVGGKLYKGDVTIPSTIEYDGNTYKVTEINTYAFMGCRELTSVSLPEGLITIGFGAFDGCSGLTKINMPSTITTIDKWAFRDCTALTEVTITDISAWCNIAFDDYSNPLYFSHRLIINDQEVKNLVIPETVTTIADRAFNGFSELESVQFGNGVKTIGKYAFGWCSSLNSVIVPEEITEIGAAAFYECTALNSLKLSGSLKKIDVETFAYCNNLEEIVIPEGILGIANYAFRDCKNLKRIYLPEGLLGIGTAAFGWCENITDVYCNAKTPPVPIDAWYWSTSHFFWESFVDYSSLHVPEDAIADYKTAFSWKDFGKIVALTSEDTAIKSSTLTPGQSEKYYSVDGQKMSEPHKGFNIIRMSDGKIRKVILK